MPVATVPTRPAEPEVEDLPTPDVSAVPTANQLPGASEEPPNAVDQLAQEAAALSTVRGLLNQGRGADALAKLAELRAELPTTLLGQERDALEIEALASAGHAELARARAQLFLTMYPNSALTPRIRQFTE